ncbi:MAG: sugar ABC transporter ATP-binding protein, partial [Pseudomonadota bacterium]
MSETPAPAALKMRSISKSFGGVVALGDVDFTVAEGEVHCLAGENGSGKSTLIKIATGVYSAEAGAEIAVGGTPVARMTPGLARRLGIAVIWQDLALFPEMTVAENIAVESVLGTRPRPVNRRAMRKAASEALAKLGVSLDLSAPLRELPIAKRQIVAIARALISDVRLIFMDEPTASLTQSETDYLLAIVRTLSAAGVAVVFVSHRLAEVLDVSSAVTVLRDGKLVGVYPTSGMTQSRLTELMTGQTFDQSVSAKDHTGAPDVLRVEKLTRRGEYEDISLTIRRGEIVGLTGLLGAGRTELGLTLFGMTQADSGIIHLDGRPVRFGSNGEAIQAGVAYVSEDRLSLGLIQPQAIGDNIAITVLD